MNQMNDSQPWLAAAPLVSAIPSGPRRLQDEIAPAAMCQRPERLAWMIAPVCSAP